jgi:metallo-beta-lactamase family protein
MTPSAGPARRRPSIRFLGAARTVTGSRFLLTTHDSSVLVDCGMFQGAKEVRLRNWEPFAVEPMDIDAVVLTHAHLDHVGMLPALVKAGYRGRVHSTKGTTELAEIVLADAGRLQEEDASHANRVGSTRHRPARPLFTHDDALEAMTRFDSHAYDTPVRITDDVAVTFHLGGHILGSSWVMLTVDGYGSIVVSGDLGRGTHPILLGPDPLSAVPHLNALLIESTYGDRIHEADDASVALGEAIVRTARRGGSLIVPSFAVDRTEVLLVHLRRLREAGAIPELPVFIDSPMASAGLNVYRRAIAERWPEIRPDMFNEVDPFDTGHLEEVRTVDESKAINKHTYPSIIIAGSGMATGGRVLHHLENRLPNPNNSVLLVGYQVEGSRGRQLVDGARTLKMFGEYVDVRAEIVNLPGFSVHADSNELVAWMASATTPPRATFVVHGEEDAATALASSIARHFGNQAIVAHHDEIIVMPQRTR